MPVKRRVAKARQLVITPAMLAMFVEAEALLEDGSGAAEGDRREEFLALSGALHMALGLGPADESVFHVDEDAEEPPPWTAGVERRVASWARAQDMRREFLAAAEAASGSRRTKKPAGGPPAGQPPAS